MGKKAQERLADRPDLIDDCSQRVHMQTPPAKVTRIIRALLVILQKGPSSAPNPTLKIRVERLLRNQHRE
jgi:hypothetical protein